MMTLGKVLGGVLSVLFLAQSAPAGLLTYYAAGIDSSNNTGTIIDDLLPLPQTYNVGVPPHQSNSLAGYNSFISALNGADIGIEDFESFTGYAPAGKQAYSFTYSLDFQRLPPATGSLPVNAMLHVDDGILARIEDPNANSAGRFPVQIPVGGTQYIDTNRSSLALNVDFGSTPVDAFGFFGTDFGDFDGQVQMAITDVNGGVNTISVPHEFDGVTGITSRLNASLFFFGLTSDAPISHVSFFGSATGGEYDRFGFDNLVVAQGDPVPPVPEPSSLVLVLAGLVSLGACRKLRNRINSLRQHRATPGNGN